MKKIFCVLLVLVCVFLMAEDEDNKKDVFAGFLRFTFTIKPDGLFQNKESKGEVYYIDEVQAGHHTALVLRNKAGAPVGITLAK